MSIADLFEYRMAGMWPEEDLMEKWKIFEGEIGQYGEVIRNRYSPENQIIDAVEELEDLAQQIRFQFELRGRHPDTRLSPEGEQYGTSLLQNIDQLIQTSRKPIATTTKMLNAYNAWNSTVADLVKRTYQAIESQDLASIEDEIMPQLEKKLVEGEGWRNNQWLAENEGLPGLEVTLEDLQKLWFDAREVKRTTEPTEVIEPPVMQQGDVLPTTDQGLAY